MSKYTMWGPSDPIYQARFRIVGELLKRLMDTPALPWPRDLYRDCTGLMAQPLQQQTPRNDALSICGKEHRQNIPRTIRSTYGHGFSVTYYCSNSCKSRAAQQETPR